MPQFENVGKNNKGEIGSVLIRNVDRQFQTEIGAKTVD